MLTIDLSGKRALVTGASGQLGRTMAKTLAQCGADVAVHYFHNEAQAQKVSREIQAMGRKSVAVQADFASEESVYAMRDLLAGGFGLPDIVVNNAVSQYRWTTVLQQDSADYLDQFRSCVMQNVLMAKAFAPHMVAQKYGRIVAVNTECAIECFPTQSAYASAKRGQDGVLRCLARELGPSGVTVNQVAPGWTISERERENGLDDMTHYLPQVPLGRRGTDQGNRQRRRLPLQRPGLLHHRRLPARLRRQGHDRHLGRSLSPILLTTTFAKRSFRTAWLLCVRWRRLGDICPSVCHGARRISKDVDSARSFPLYCIRRGLAVFALGGDGHA